MKPFCSPLLFLWILATCASPVLDKTGITPAERATDQQRAELHKECEHCIGHCLWENTLAQCLVHCYRELGYVCPDKGIGGEPYRRSPEPPDPEAATYRTPQPEAITPKGAGNPSGFDTRKIIDTIWGQMAYHLARSTAVRPLPGHRIPALSRGFR